ncbi:MAG: GDP-mannose 4,6-dehydratase, partial [Coleofasciculus sp. C2-GNP5-27]
GADKIVESFHLSFGLPVVTVRPFNTYGPRQSARAVIPTIITQCLGKKIIRLGNLNPTRDLTFVEDTVSGFLAAATTDKAIGMTINLGSGAEISIGDLALKIINLCGSNNTLETEDKRLRPPASEVERLISDNSKARELVGWTPSVDLKDGLQQTIDWFRQNQDKYHPGEYTL